MAEFKVIFRLDQDWDARELPIPWAEGCPLAVEKMQVARNVETGEAYFQAKLRNVSDREVFSYKAVFTCSYEDGTEEQKPVETLDADIAAGGYAEIRPLKLSRGDVKNVRLSIRALKTTLGNWEIEGEITRMPIREVLLLGSEAEKERVYQLKQSGCVVFPTAENHCCESHGSWWRCACGAVNVGYAKCRFCGIDPGIEKTLRDKDQLIAAAQDRRAEEERKKKLEEEKREERKRHQREKLDRAKAKAKIFFGKHKKKILVPTVMACLIVAIAGIAFYVSTPEKAFAVYSDSDNSLTFYKEKFVPNSGSTFKGKNCTSVYEGVEGSSSEWNVSAKYVQTGWVKDHGGEIHSVSFEDEIEPVDCRTWFAGLRYCTSFDLDKLNTRKATDFAYMFFDCASAREIDFDGFETRNVKTYSGMFKGCTSLTELDLSSFKTTEGREFSWMFDGCLKLSNLNLSSFDTRSAQNLSGMFSGCEKLRSIDLSRFNTGNAENLSRMFSGCTSLQMLDLSSFDASSVKEFDEMFSRCGQLQAIKGADCWSVSKGKSFAQMFAKCKNLSLDCSKWDVSGIDPERSDTVTSLFNDGAPGVISPVWPSVESTDRSSAEQANATSSSEGVAASSSGSSGANSGHGTSGTAPANPWK